MERALGVQMPASLRRIYEAGDGRFNALGQWWVFWPLDRVATDAPLAWERGMPRHVLPFGEDGTGNPFCLDLRASAATVQRWNWIDGDFESNEGAIDVFIQTWVESSESN